MVEVNEYFDGSVKSLEVSAEDGRKTVGVMQPGEYDFETETTEIMTVVFGEISVYYEDEGEWEDYGVGASFDVPAESTLKVKTSQDSVYLCEYE
ncbi:hypothetical protein BVX94_03875 [bacterium B17]|nr:hypothetical protein BVX94_03875 [bacterium B17]